MRDKHSEQCHQKQQGPMVSSQELDDDEIQPLLFDLVRSDKVDLIKPFARRLKKLNWKVTKEVLLLAARYASPAMVDLLKSFLGNDAALIPNYLLSTSAIKGNNVETFKHFLQDFQNYNHVLPDILKSGSKDFLADWETYIDTGCERSCQLSHKKWAGMCIHYTRWELLAAATDNPENEAFILSLWKRIGLIKLSTKEQLGSVLLTVAEKSCSIKLAQYLLEAGAVVDFRRSVKYLTPLHHATTHDTPKAAELVELLLNSGADPEAFSQSSPAHGKKIRRIKDEKGAKGVSKWLVLSWDELVAKTSCQTIREV